MKNEFVADGARRLANAQNANSIKAVRAKYADDWEKANCWKRMQLRFQIWRECANQMDVHTPSPGTLW